MTNQRTLILPFLALPALVACNPDIASDLVGSYQGELVANDTMDLEGEVSVAVVDNNHVDISGQDFGTFEVALMSDGNLVTHSLDDADTVLSWSSNTLSFTHDALDSVQFNGSAIAGSGDDDGGDDGGDDGALGDTVSGTYSGIIGGPINDLDYTLTLTASGDNSVRISGDGIETFEVPLSETAGGVEEAGNWSEGSFVHSGQTLEIVHDPQSMSFTGERN